MTARRGQCPVCRYRWRLRKDGTLQAHHLYSGSERRPECEGSGKVPVTPQLQNPPHRGVTAQSRVPWHAGELSGYAGMSLSR